MGRGAARRSHASARRRERCRRGDAHGRWSIHRPAGEAEGAGVRPLSPGTACARIEQAAIGRQELTGPGVPGTGSGPFRAVVHPPPLRRRRCPLVRPGTWPIRRPGTGPMRGSAPSGERWMCPGPARSPHASRPPCLCVRECSQGRAPVRRQAELPSGTGGGASCGGMEPATPACGGVPPARSQAGRQFALCRAFHGVEGSGPVPGCVQRTARGRAGAAMHRRQGDVSGTAPKRPIRRPARGHPRGAPAAGCLGTGIARGRSQGSVVPAAGRRRAPSGRWRAEGGLWPARRAAVRYRWHHHRRHLTSGKRASPLMNRPAPLCGSSKEGGLGAG
jgi:hypothetical protein